jgi:hypothetical protein
MLAAVKKNMLKLVYKKCFSLSYFVSIASLRSSYIYAQEEQIEEVHCNRALRGYRLKRPVCLVPRTKGRSNVGRSLKRTPGLSCCGITRAHNFERFYQRKSSKHAIRACAFVLL